MAASRSVAKLARPARQERLDHAARGRRMAGELRRHRHGRVRATMRIIGFDECLDRGARRGRGRVRRQSRSDEHAGHTIAHRCLSALGGSDDGLDLGKHQAALAVAIPGEREIGHARKLRPIAVSIDVNQSPSIAGWDEWRAAGLDVLASVPRADGQATEERGEAVTGDGARSPGQGDRKQVGPHGHVIFCRRPHGTAPYRAREPVPEGGATISLFLGVRYERWAAPADGVKTRREPGLAMRYRRSRRLSKARS